MPIPCYSWQPSAELNAPNVSSSSFPNSLFTGVVLERPDWQSIVRILSERGAGDDEMLIFAMTIINKTLNGVPDQDTFFDVVDNLESQNFESITKALVKMNNPQLNQQLELYERELKKEDAALDSDSSDGTMAKMR